MLYIDSMRYEVGHVQRIGKYSGKERRLYFVRDRVTQHLVHIDEKYRALYTSRKRIAEARQLELEAANRLPVKRSASDWIAS